MTTASEYSTGESASTSEKSVGEPATISEQSRNNDNNQVAENKERSSSKQQL